MYVNFIKNNTKASCYFMIHADKLKQTIKNK